MAEYDPRPELMALPQNLLEKYDHQFNQEIKENMAILSHLSQWEAGWRKGAMQRDPAGPQERKNKMLPSWLH